ncbi:MAG: low-specificity L-threonine aldolase [Anaerolineaceae bacterium]|nr:low-specificity L-threonine aldolase [Anaerolineaceae bacterium]
MQIIDLRSDTVTQPTAEMREAMANAVVGDDVYGEDPTILELERAAAGEMGKAAGLFVTSGTMGNLLAVLATCQRGDEVIMGRLGHTFLYECGGISALGGVQPHPITERQDGTLPVEDVRRAIRVEDVHEPVTRMVIVENTQNRCGGQVLGMDYLRAVGELTHQHGLALHIDGARIYNAAAALNLPAAELAGPADSVTFCLSKGLCAPVGSVLCGSQAFIQRARKYRKMLGGGMRQAGVLAAAGLVALRSMTVRLGEDHRRAAQLAGALAALPGVRLPLGNPPTNMVYVELDGGRGVGLDAFIERLKQRGVLAGDGGDGLLRLVLHHGIDDQDVAHTVAAFGEALAAH